MVHKHDQSTKARAKQRIVAHMGVGIAFGLAIGAAAGNVTLGLIGGIVLGGIGVAIWRTRYLKAEKHSDEQT